MKQGRLIVPRKFYQQETRVVAQSLLGKILVSATDDESVSGRIVETEAYLPANDSACHAAKHRTARTEIMFGPAGFAYVYPIHARYCFNIVTELPEFGCAVLIRAVEPLDGIEIMKRRRGVEDVRRLTTGPACLCQAFHVDRSHNGIDLTEGARVWVEHEKNACSPHQVLRTVRIGVTSAKTLKLRYLIQGNEFVSGPSHLGLPKK